jgi:membrane protein
VLLIVVITMFSVLFYAAPNVTLVGVKWVPPGHLSRVDVAYQHALLLGMELNAERECSRELKAGIPGADGELQLDARSTPKRRKKT